MSKDKFAHDLTMLVLSQELKTGGTELNSIAKDYVQIHGQLISDLKMLTSN